ncbi:protein polybromo-1-like [Lytechinus pictus]|uniref:protein polybromo-1-like n=1 Tax=Lytechinus pictus TaxID=7653 RepID=UPI0030B9FC43
MKDPDVSRHYSKEGSTVYEDADLFGSTSERRVMKLVCLQSSGPVGGGFGTPKSLGQKRTPVKRSPAKTLSALSQKLDELLNAIKSHTDQHGRELSPSFFRLPSKNEHPEYYRVIKCSMDRQHIQQKIWRL